MIVYWLEQMQIEKLIDQEFPSPHGNRRGLSYGQLSVLLLTYIISQADHRQSAVEPWVNQHHRTLEIATGWKIEAKDATDDRLADKHECFRFKSARSHPKRVKLMIGLHLIRAYELSERWLVIQSYALAQRQQKGLEQRLLNAEKALAKLAAKPGEDSIALQESVDSILQRHRVSDYLLTNIHKKITYAKVYESPGRPGPNRPFRRVRQTTLTLTYQRHQTAIAEFKTLAGYRLYVTNATPKKAALRKRGLLLPGTMANRKWFPSF